LVANLECKIEDLKKQQQATIIQLDDLEQYGRRKNLEIQGIPPMRNENT